jgi:transcription antitermination protein NusB
MLSRRVLRIKTMQALYGFFQSGSDRIDKEEKVLLHSTEEVHDLYVYQLSALVEIIEATRKQIESGLHKYFPTKEEADPQTRFVDNRVISLIENDELFRKRFNELRINWADQQELFKKLSHQVRNSPEYETYMSASISSFEKDRHILVCVFRDQIAACEELEQIYEEMNIHWAGDYDVVSYLIIKMLNTLEENGNPGRLIRENLAPARGKDEDEDKAFMLDLFRKTIVHAGAFDTLIAGKAQNWELERIALMDTILLRMALTELTCMPSIPVKVTINEYIEISKIYSSAKSKVFINGVLDNIIADLKQANKIKKTGRGLME